MKPLLSLSLLFLLRSSTASVQSMEEKDATRLIDLVLDLFKETSTPHIPVSNFTFDIGNLTNQILGNWSGRTGWIGDMQSLRRASPVVTSNSGNNLTLATSFTFEELWGSWYRTELNIQGLTMIGDIFITFNENEFTLELNVSKKPETGRCEVRVQKAAFTLLSDIKINFRPLGFFNKLTLDATLTHINQSLFRQMDLFNMTHLADFLQLHICSNIPK